MQGMQKTVVAAGRAFSKMETAMLKKIFWKKGKQPSSFTQKKIDDACKLQPNFRRMYEELVRRKEEEFPGSGRAKARNSIRKSVMM